MRFLRRRWLDDDILVMPTLAVMRKAAVRRPSLAQKRHRLVVALAGFLQRNAEAVELAPAVALSDTEIEPSIVEKVQCRSLFGEQSRIVPGQHQDRRAEP